MPEPEISRKGVEPWVDIVRDMIFARGKGVDGLLCTDSDLCFSNDKWMGVMENDGVCFVDSERLQLLFSEVSKNPMPPSLYQVRFDLSPSLSC